MKTKKRLHLSKLTRLSVGSFVTSLPLPDEEKIKVIGGETLDCPTAVSPCPQPTVSTALTCAAFGERGVDILGL